MMSRCTICRASTDLALSDVLTPEQIKRLGGLDKVPLIGTCGDAPCIERQLERETELEVRHARR